MPVFDEFRNIFKAMRVYLLGRGFLSLLVMGTAFAVGAASPLVLGLVAAGGLALSAGVRLYSQALYEDDMADLYREDIAKHLHMDPRAVTRTHLKIAARENEVIDQALTRQRHINIVSFATSALAAAATFGLLMFGLAGTVSSFFATSFPSLAGINFGFMGFADFTAAKLLQLTSVGIVSGFTSLVLHNGLEEAIGYGTGLSKAVAHDLIAAMDFDIKRGRTISPEQVYGVLVAENPELATRIKRQFGEAYDSMKPNEQTQVLAALNVQNDMKEIAGFITRREVPAGRLAYMMHYARPEKKREDAPVEIAPTRGKFVERLNLVPREATRFADQIAASREPALMAR